MTVCSRCAGTGTEPDHALIGQQIRRYRFATGATLATVAGRMGVSIQYLSDLERGHRNWNTDLVERVYSAMRRAS